MPQNSEEPKLVKVNCNKLFNAILTALITIGFNIFYTYSYAEVSSDVKDTVLFKCFLAYIILAWCGTVIHGFNIKNIIQYFGQTIPAPIWDHLQDINKYPYCFLKLSHAGALGLGCYFMGKFIPYQDCSVYEDVIFGYTNTCVSMKIISFFTIFGLCAIGLVILLLSCVGCCYCCLLCVNSEHRSSISSNNLSFARSYLTSYVPIPVPSKDTECIICRLAVADDQAKPWTALSCEHKFHSQCVTEWMKYKPTCPLCRAEITIPQSGFSNV